MFCGLGATPEWTARAFLHRISKGDLDGATALLSQEVRTDVLREGLKAVSRPIVESGSIELIETCHRTDQTATVTVRIVIHRSLLPQLATPSGVSGARKMP